MDKPYKIAEYRGVDYEVYVEADDKTVAAKIQDRFGIHRISEKHNYVENGQEVIIPDSFRADFIKAVCDSVEDRFKAKVDEWQAQDSEPKF